MGASCYAGASFREADLLDVHAPHEKIHGIGDFFLHLFTITVGLLIALGLEALVERVHHHHQRDEAEAYLRREIEDNRRELKTTTDAIPGEIHDLLQARDLLQSRMENKAVAVRSVQLGLRFGSPSHAGWQTALASGVVGYMEYGRAKEFAAAYQAQETFTQLTGRSLDQFLQVESYMATGDPATISPQTAQIALGDVQKELANLRALQQLGGALQQAYDDAIKSGGA